MSRDERVSVTFKEASLVDKYMVAVVAGTCGGGSYPGPVAVNAIDLVKDQYGVDVTKETGLGGKSIVIHSENIRFIIAEK